MSILDAARAAYAAGLCILPVAEDGSKRPAVAAWREIQLCRPTPEEMRTFGFGQRLGVGVIAGSVSQHRECWDFDCGAVYQAFVEAAEPCGLGEIVDRISKGYCDATPGGGRRWIVAYPPSVQWKDCTLARRPGRDGEPSVKTLIELPTFAIIAPSHGATHPTGKPYERLSGGFNKIAGYTVEQRDELITLARSFDQMPRRQHAPRAAGSTMIDSKRPGDDFNRRVHWSDVLAPYGWCDSLVRDGVTHWTRPGKEHGTSATTNYGGSDLLWVFSSSTPFQPDKSYDKFAAYAILNHEGDFAAAARALVEQGYGEVLVSLQRTEVPAAAQKAVWRWMTNVPAECVRWLWRLRLALGKLTILTGDGGMGKSRVSNDIVARYSTARAWPDGQPQTGGTAVILSAEDHAGDTIRPALEVMGADLQRVAILDAVQDPRGDRLLNLQTDLGALESLLDETGAGLVVIDPLSAYLGTSRSGFDSYRDTDVRALLEPVTRLAERRGVAILGIMHVGKASERSARHRVLGSVAFVNAARCVFAVGSDPDDPDLRLIVPVKTNFREASLLAFRLEDTGGDIPRVVWSAPPTRSVSPEEVLNGTANPADRGEQQDAVSFLTEMLEHAPNWRLPTTDILAAARRMGISERTINRAKKQLGVKAKLVGYGSDGVWWWILAEAATGLDQEGLAPSGPEQQQNPSISLESAKRVPVSPVGSLLDTNLDDIGCQESATVLVAPSEELALKPPDHSEGASAELRDVDFERF